MALPSQPEGVSTALSPDVNGARSRLAGDLGSAECEAAAPPLGLKQRARHIVVIMHDFSTGGSERIAIRLANQWAERGRHITIMSGVADGPARGLVSPGVRVLTPDPEVHRTWRSRIMLGYAFAKMIALEKPDLVFSPGNFHAPIVAMLGGKLGAARPVIVSKISNPLRKSGHSWIRQWAFGQVTRRLLAPADVLVAMSATLQKEGAAVLRREIAMIHEPILDRQGNRSGRASLRAPPLIVCAGRLEHQKNFALAIAAFAKLDPLHGIHMLILGDGSEGMALAADIQARGLADRITLAGHVSDIGPALAKARLFLMTSRYEGYPAVLLEALAEGVPIVTTNCSPAIGEIMMHHSFGRVTTQTPDALVASIIEVLGCSDPDPIAAEILLSQHRVEQVADHYLDLFDRTLTRVARTRSSGPDA